MYESVEFIINFKFFFGFYMSVCFEYIERVVFFYFYGDIMLYSRKIILFWLCFLILYMFYIILIVLVYRNILFND